MDFVWAGRPLPTGDQNDRVDRIGAGPDVRLPPPAAGLWIERLTLTNFRNYVSATIEARPGPVVLTGSNGAGKTNLLEAVSLLAPGQGLRGVAFDVLGNQARAADWAVAARVHTAAGALDIGTGTKPGPSGASKTGRIVRVDGETRSGSGILADWVEMVWLTPSMDGLFTGPAADRRRFLDRLILCFDPGYRTRIGHFERAMRQRNKLLGDGVRDASRFEGLEMIMAETGVAMAAARAEAVAQLAATISQRLVREPASPFPWGSLALEGRLERALVDRPAVEVEDIYLDLLKVGRERDRAAGRALEGPHRSDLMVRHGPKDMAASQCSTGEQKALLVGLILAHAELVAERREGRAPILLLDEIAAHLDSHRRAALFGEILRLGAQCWMTGTDREGFDSLIGSALFLNVEDGRVTRMT